MQIKVQGMVEMEHFIGVEVPKQVNFATMLAINDTAKAIQKHEVETQLPSKLTLRSRGTPWWKPGNKFGINIKPYAKKNSLRAVIGSQADWLTHQEEGGTRKAKGHRLAIEAGARPGKTAVLPRSLKPRQLLASKGEVIGTSRGGRVRRARSDGRGFIINTKSGPAIFIRQGDALKLMYMLEQSAEIPPILEFAKSAEVVVDDQFDRLFAIRFTKAIQTAKT